jgi:predicted nucleic-acid-binding protein
VDYLADTNVVTRWALADDPQYLVVRAAVLQLQQRGESVFVTAQVLVEFQALATRPVEANGLGLNRQDAQGARRNDRVTG